MTSDGIQEVGNMIKEQKYLDDVMVRTLQAFKEENLAPDSVLAALVAMVGNIIGAMPEETRERASILVIRGLSELLVENGYVNIVMGTGIMTNTVPPEEVN